MSDIKKYTENLIRGGNMGPIRLPEPPMQGPVVKRKEPGTIKPKVSITTKKGIDITGGANITKYKDSDYKEPAETYFDLSKEGDNYSYGITGSKKGKRKQITIGGTIKYSRGGGVSIQGTKFNGVK
jgi:hypothetical protein